MLKETQNILDRLKAADREHQKETGGRFLLRSVKYLCAFVLAAFVLDVVWHLDAKPRLALLLCLSLGLLVLVIAGWYLAFIRRNRPEHVARLLESRDAALGSRLINLLQLNNQTTDETLTPLTRDLAKQAVEDYAKNLTGARLEQLGRSGELRRHFFRAAWATLGFAAILAAFFRIATIEAVRFADPFGDHPPYSFTQLEIVQPALAGTNVLYGKGFVVRVKSHGHQPKEVFLTFYPAGHPEKSITVPMFDKGKSGFDQLLDNIRTETIAYAHTKDRVSVSKQARIGVILTPQIEKTFVRVIPPAYTQLKPEEKPYNFKGVQALAGSEIQFRIQSNRPLKEGMMEMAIGDQMPQKLTMKPTAENEVSGSLRAVDSGRLRFSVTDTSGLPSQGETEGALTVTHDLPPEIRISEPAEDAFVAMDFKLQAHIDASDDYGLTAVRIHRGLNGVYSAPKVVNYEGIVHDAQETVNLRFAELGIEPGDIVSLYAEAVDNAPEPHLSHSQTVRFKVISVEDYNNFLREQTDLADAEAKYSGLMDDLQDLIEQQKKFSDEAKKIEDQLAKVDAKKRDEMARDLDALIARQNELNKQLDQQADRMENFVRDNPLYDVEKDLQQHLSDQAKNIRDSTKTNAAAARSVAQQSTKPDGGRQLSPDMAGELKQQSDEQAQRLGGIKQEAESQIEPPLEDMAKMQELMKDFNQFESLYQAQQELAAQSQAYNRPGQLGREDQLALKELASSQKDVADALKELGDKLRADADDAQKLFPKASQSGRDLAKKMDELRLRSLAQQATDQMLAGSGEQSFSLADRLRGEMAKLFGECKGGNSPGNDELDGYLKLKQFKPGNNFAQMSRSRKFGMGGKIGLGEGQSGKSGYAVMNGPQAKVMGNEHFAGRGKASARQSSPQGRGTGALADGSRTDADKSDAVHGLNPVNRQSGAVTSEGVIDEYNDVVNSYFKTITTKKKEQ